jgi:tRNA(Ile)-lysidine synthase
MDAFEQKMLESIQSKALFDGADKILLAISGGADSVAMVHALAELKKRSDISCEFVIGHVNHCLRGDASDADETFVKEVGSALGLSVISQRIDVNEYAYAKKLSIGTAGRMVRLQSLSQMAEHNKCEAIVTAHHKDDLAETMVHRLMRGTGFRGLCGIWPVSEVYGVEFIRPMLLFRKEEIIQYCNDRSIQWREDASNRNICFTRNKIRHHLLQAFKSTDLVQQLAVLSAKSQRFLLSTEKHAESIVTKGHVERSRKYYCIDQDLLCSCPPWVLYETLRKILVNLDVGLRKYTQDHFTVIREMLRQQTAKASFPGQIEFSVKRGTASFQFKMDTPVLPLSPVELEVGQTVQFGPWEITATLLKAGQADIKQFLKYKDSFVEWFDPERIHGALKVRSRQDGDRFSPIGAQGPKKVGRFLIDADLDGDTKRDFFVIRDAEKILWLSPLRMSEEAKLTPKTKKILEIRVRQIKPRNKEDGGRNSLVQKGKTSR